MGRRVRKKHIFFNLNWKKQRSGQKYKKAIEWYVDLLKRQDRDGMTKWLEKTMPKAEARIKKYGINRAQIVNVLEHKGLKKLVSFLDERVAV